MQLDLYVAGHPGQLSGAEAAHGGQLQPQRVGKTHSLAGIRAAAAGRPSTAASGGRRASPAAPTGSESAGSGPEACPALAWLLLRLLLEAGPLAAVVGAFCQRSDEAQVAGDVSAGGPLARHGTPRLGRYRLQRRCAALPSNGPPSRRPRRSRQAHFSYPSQLRTLLAVTSSFLYLSYFFCLSSLTTFFSFWPSAPRVLADHLSPANCFERALSGTHPPVSGRRGRGPRPQPSDRWLSICLRYCCCTRGRGLHLFHLE